MRIFKMFVRVTLFVLLLALGNSLLTFVLTPAEDFDVRIWKEFRKEQNIDTLFLGSSVCTHSFIADVFDEELNCHSYSLGITAQPLNHSLESLRIALEDHPIRQVVLGFGYFTLMQTQNDRLDSTFLQATTALLDPMRKAMRYASTVLDPKNIQDSSSINLFFPWIYNNVPLTLTHLRRNIAEKLAGMPDQERMDYYYGGKGLIYKKSTDDFRHINFDSVSAEIYDLDFYPECVEQLKELCLFCKDHNIDLVVVNTPRPVYDVVYSGPKYYREMDALTALCSEYGALYMDYNLVKPEWFTPEDEYFFDHEHLNLRGAEVFSRSLARMLAERNAGVDISAYFYMPDEYLQSVAAVQAVQLTLEDAGDCANLSARAVSGCGKAEYRFVARDEATGEETLVQDYSTEDHAKFTPKHHGRYTLRVDAKMPGSQLDVERCGEAEYEI